jgi:magnesium chelatase subunit D
VASEEDPPPEEMPPEEPPDEPPPEQPPEQNDEDEDKPPPDVDKPLDDVVLAAALSAMPPGLLAQLRAAQFMRQRSSPPGRTGVARAGGARGRPVGVRRGMPEAGARLNVVETLRNAAPWQPLRRREVEAAALEKGITLVDGVGPRVQVRQDDFRVTRFKQRAQTTSIFVVDASGSAALHRLAEAKGAVELLLADCYVRRDRVALIAFRGQVAEVLLPPTRSLVRAKRSLSGLPGGGGTPLAAGIDAAAELADAVRRRGETPLLVFLTDGRANVGRDGRGGRPQAEQDAISAARMLRAANVNVLFVDTSAQPSPQAQKIAREMDALYLPLPYADASGISKTIRAASPAARSAG